MSNQALATTMSSRGVTITRTLRAAFAALEDHDKVAPAEVEQIVGMLIAHVRSWKPMVAIMPSLDTGPLTLIEPPVNEIERSICAEGKYRLSFDEGHLALVVTDEGDTACGVMTPAMAEALIADVRRVIGGR